MTNGRIGRIASRLRRAAKAPFWVDLVDDIEGDRLNAAADAENRVVKITKQLVDKLTDDELAWVVSHEFAHLQAGHRRKFMDWVQEKSELIKNELESRDQRLAEAGRGFVSRVVSQVTWGVIDGTALYVWAHLQSQKNETEADQRALEIAVAAGFDPTASVSALRKLNGGSLHDRGFFEDLVATHPSPARRGRALETETRQLRRRR